MTLVRILPLDNRTSSHIRNWGAQPLLTLATPLPCFYICFNPPPPPTPIQPNNTCTPRRKPPCLCCWSLLTTSWEACNQSWAFHIQTPPLLAPPLGHVLSCICQQQAVLVSHSYSSWNLDCWFDLWCLLWYRHDETILEVPILIH